MSVYAYLTLGGRSWRWKPLPLSNLPFASLPNALPLSCCRVRPKAHNTRFARPYLVGLIYPPPPQCSSLAPPSASGVKRNLHSLSSSFRVEVTASLTRMGAWAKFCDSEQQRKQASRKRKLRKQEWRERPITERQYPSKVGATSQ